MIKLKPLLISLAISLGTGGLSALFTSSSMEIYGSIAQPPLAPPGWLFPVVWTVLFILMGIAAYRIYVSQDRTRRAALTLYAMQLAANFIWTLIFFSARAYLAAFIWLLLLIALIAATIWRFYRIDKLSAYLMLPYLAWCVFATYLNLGIYLLNG